ncbi:MAG: hypothetical protein ACREFL_05540 [Stellaceae bacterium]
MAASEIGRWRKRRARPTQGRLRLAAGLGAAALALCTLWGCAESRDAEVARDGAACARGAPPTYSVGLLLPEPNVDDTLSIAQIAERSQADYRYLTLGATIGKLVIVGVARPRVSEGVTGGDCAYPQAVAISMTLAQRVIHVAREFSGTEPCVYREVLDHERRHVALDDRLLAAEKTALASTLPTRLADLDGVWGKNAAAARSALSTRLQADVQILQDDIEAKRHAAHAAQIDTFDERHRLANACGGRLKQLYPSFD